MRLKQLKLVGFKSFVERTVIPVESRLIAVVGPNGCGKSNVIEAIRWCLGESSAKQLRSDLMSDVIFNGCKTRKALGQASVEILFESDSGKETSLKRTITRDGTAQYFLNQIACRKRDITDLFLGTGVGAKGYAIISQGTISEIIEADEYDLRLFLEEAGGVSKYKERRRETLEHLSYTRENLSQVQTIIHELDTQLAHLSQQAKKAKSYHDLMQRILEIKENILTSRWLINEKAKKILCNQVRQHDETKQTLQSNLTLNEETIYQKKHNIQVASDHVEKCKEKSHSLHTALIKLNSSFEQTLLNEARLQRVIQDKLNSQKKSEDTLRRLVHNKDQLIQSLEAISLKKISEKDSITVLKTKHETLRKEFQLLSTSWEEKQNSMMTHRHQLDKLDLKKQNNLNDQSKLNQSLAQLDDEAKTLESDALHDSVRSLKDCHEIIQNEIKHQAILLKEMANSQESLETDLKKQKMLHAGVNEEIFALEKELASLSGLQAALTKESPKENSLSKDCQRLFEHLTFPVEWQTAIEGILSELLTGICLTNSQKAMEITASPGLYIELRPKSVPYSALPKTLAEMTNFLPATCPSLEDIFAVNTLEEAKKLLSKIKPYQSILTKEGIWLGNGWIRFPTKEDHLGLLRSQASINDNKECLRQRLVQLFEYEKTIQSITEAIQLNDHHQKDALEKHTKLKEQERSSYLALQQKLHALEHAIKRQEKIQEKRKETCEKLIKLNEDYLSMSHSQKPLLDAYEKCKADLESLSDKKRRLEQSSNEVEDHLTEARQRLHQLELEESRAEQSLLHLKQTLDRIHKEMKSDAQELLKLGKDLSDGKDSQAALKKILEETQIEKDKLDKDIQEKTNYQQGLLKELKGMEKELDQLKQRQHELALEEAHLNFQDTSIKKEEALLLQEASEFSSDQPQVVWLELKCQQTLSHDFSMRAAKEELRNLEASLKALGAVNLIAIDEFNALQSRRDVIYKQYEDLTASIKTLECAISKMDSEHEKRLRDTFHAVNHAFGQLFPRLFGGGKGTLSLSSDNLLEAGIILNAEPPGKKTTRLKLLSGGEKALTAIALIFAFFQLNPAPFCMLDEVDAPLDELNVTRFCHLVKEMSSMVQFLLITHNKITMEMADQLIGVTMREPGVSQVVTVKIKEALSLAT